jgi:hypothetical protein
MKEMFDELKQLCDLKSEFGAMQAMLEFLGMTFIISKFYQEMQDVRWSSQVWTSKTGKSGNCTKATNKDIAKTFPDLGISIVTTLKAHNLRTKRPNMPCFQDAVLIQSQHWLWLVQQPQRGEYQTATW